MPDLTISHLFAGLQRQSSSGQGNDPGAPVSFIDVLLGVSESGDAIVDSQQMIVPATPANERDRGLELRLALDAMLTTQDSDEQSVAIEAASLLSIPNQSIVSRSESDVVTPTHQLQIPNENQGITGLDELKPRSEWSVPKDHRLPMDQPVMVEQSSVLSAQSPIDNSSQLKTVVSEPLESGKPNIQIQLPPFDARTSAQSPEAALDVKNVEAAPVEIILPDEAAGDELQPNRSTSSNAEPIEDRQLLGLKYPSEIRYRESNLAQRANLAVEVPNASASRQSVTNVYSGNIRAITENDGPTPSQHPVDTPPKREIVEQLTTSTKDGIAFGEHPAASLDARPAGELGGVRKEAVPNAGFVESQTVVTDSTGGDDTLDNNDVNFDLDPMVESERAGVDISYHNDGQPSGQHESKASSYPTREQTGTAFAMAETPINSAIHQNAPQSDLQATQIDAGGKVAQETGAPSSDLKPIAVTQQVVTALNDAVDFSEGSFSRTVSLELQPEELGRLKIYIEQNAEVIATQIVATELISSDLLTSQKDALLEALAELGFENASVDISHEGREHSSPEQNPKRNKLGQFLEQEASDSTGRKLNAQKPSGLDIVA